MKLDESLQSWNLHAVQLDTRNTVNGIHSIFFCPGALRIGGWGRGAFTLSLRVRLKTHIILSINAHITLTRLDIFRVNWLSNVGAIELHAIRLDKFADAKSSIFDGVCCCLNKSQHFQKL